MNSYTGGAIGEFFAALAFAGALVALVSLLRASFLGGREKLAWERLGTGAFLVHGLSIAGVIGTLFYLIYTHQYQYFYVYDHSSNELPVHYMISCFWEGQEGSFLLWCFWHCVLGFMMLRSKSEWRNLVLATIASVEMILTSMILGIYIPEGVVQVIYLSLLILPLGYMAYQSYLHKNRLSPARQNLFLAGILLGLGTLILLIRAQGGFAGALTLGNAMSLQGLGFLMFMLATFVGVFLLFRYVYWYADHQPHAHGDTVAMISILAAAIAGIWFEADVWKLGSNPFISLRDAFPDDPTLQANPDFLPTNGRGLNSLLQNYWMVIHPPTLFLGFASTIVPFGFVMAGLMKGNYRDWIRPSMPWTTFSVMILGIGIIMGGYWAYETLNFGGYWNWDPVENSSFVPWLCGVAALHAMLIHQRTKAYLHMAMLLIITTFLLVLYSTFLTRSGILGETSVHTFTDLGLSGQLLVLVFIYLAWVSITFLWRWRHIPTREDESKVWSPEFMLFLGVLVLIFASVAIIGTTSLPVINKILGTSIAPPVNLQLFYYQWNVWFAIAFGVLSGLGQFLWWRVKEQKSLGDAVFRPFVLAMVTGCAILIFLAYYRMPFAFNDEFAEIIDPARRGTGFSMVMAYIRYGFVAFTDELLLFSALFGLAANADILIGLLRRNKKGLKVMGGTVVHIGFAMMLLGMLFSSGYDEVITQNLSPDDLPLFPEEERTEHVALMKNRPRQIQDYLVTYVGRRQAEGPVDNLRLLEETGDYFKVSFEDQRGEVYGMVLPRNVFVDKDRSHEEATVQPTADPVSSVEGLEGSLDYTFTLDFLNENLEAIRPKHLNNREYYGVRFTSIRDTSHTFVLYPEAEENEQMGGMIAHPNRRIYWNHDIYTYVSSVPPEEDQRPQYRYHDRWMGLGDTAWIGRTQLYLARVREISKQQPELAGYQVAAAADLLVVTPVDTFVANPIYLIDPENKRGMIEASVPEVFMDFAFVDIDPNAGKMRIQVQQQVNPSSDVIVIQAIRKPFINLLWLGTFILTAGFLISIYRRVQENRKRK